MLEKDYESHIDKPTVHTTSNGSSYVTAFDVLRSTQGRELINRHAEMAKSLGLTKAGIATIASGQTADKIQKKIS